MSENNTKSSLEYENLFECDECEHFDCSLLHIQTHKANQKELTISKSKKEENCSHCEKAICCQIRF